MRVINNVRVTFPWSTERNDCEEASCQEDGRRVLREAIDHTHDLRRRSIQGVL